MKIKKYISILFVFIFLLPVMVHANDDISNISDNIQDENTYELCDIDESNNISLEYDDIEQSDEIVSYAATSNLVDINCSCDLVSSERQFQLYGLKKEDSHLFGVQLYKEINGKLSSYGKGTIKGSSNSSNRRSISFSSLSPGIYYIYEYDLPDNFYVDDVIAKNSIEGISVEKYGEGIKVVIGNSIPDGRSKLNVQFCNALEYKEEPKVSLKLSNTFSSDILDKLKIDENNNIISSIMTSNGEVLNFFDNEIINNIEINNTYIISTKNHLYFNDINLSLINNIDGVSITKTDDVFLLEIKDKIIDDTIIELEISCSSTKERLYNSLFESNSEFGF